MRKRFLTTACAAVVALAPVAAFAQDGQTRAVADPGKGGAAGVQVAADTAIEGVSDYVTYGGAAVVAGVGGWLISDALSEEESTTGTTGTTGTK